MSTIVVDLDGTLNNCVHRIEDARFGHWDLFHSKLEDDEPYYDVEWLLKRLPSTIPVIACTGRDEAYREKTLTWLAKWNIALDEILMRPTGDYTPDHELKPRLLEKFFGSKELVIDNVMFVLDDRDKVVEAWRNYGLPCWQVRPGGY